MYSSQYLQFTDTVPFLAIALRGELDLFGANANFYAYARDELLRLIDYGIYPSLLLLKIHPVNFKKLLLNIFIHRSIVI